jgi:diaminohydroxyphosphoribosylaminopyrimidine deaminase/5-amino-6-(5-phosphoribosylamino)uracil reductase
MGRALTCARLGLGHTKPNPAVGCVIARGGRVLAEGHHRKAGEPHAEIVALRKAGRRATGATVYVTLEPCCHHGRTPPCTDALIAARPNRVVIGCRDPDPRVSGRGIRRLRAAGIDVVVGVAAEESRDVVRGFSRWVREGTPWVQLKLAASLDGRIATRTGASKWISSRDSRRVVQTMRARADAIAVGVGTVLLDDPRLTCRLAGATQPLRIVLDRRLRTPVGARVVRGKGDCLLICGPEASPAARRRLETAGCEVLEITGRGRLAWLRILRHLGRRGFHEILIEGGAGVAASALAARVVNGATFFYNPRLIGGDGVPMVAPLRVHAPGAAIVATTVSWAMSGPDLVWNGVFE